jgi:hypothetical protein
MKPFVYDADYVPEHQEGSEIIPTAYPSWYGDVGGQRDHLMQWGSLTDGEGHELNYVRYVTLQASGYKTTSNKELPHENVPWLSNYYPANNTASNRFKADTKNGGQNYPHYILWRVGTGDEVTDPTKKAQTPRELILGRVYKVQPTTNRKSGWVYTYNIPYSSSVLEKIGGNGSSRPNEYIIVEKNFSTPVIEVNRE